jgi:hypothetical protein
VQCKCVSSVTPAVVILSTPEAAPTEGDQCMQTACKDDVSGESNGMHVDDLNFDQAEPPICRVAKDARTHSQGMTLPDLGLPSLHKQVHTDHPPPASQ